MCHCWPVTWGGDQGLENTKPVLSLSLCPVTYIYRRVPLPKRVTDCLMSILTLFGSGPSLELVPLTLLKSVINNTFWLLTAETLSLILVIFVKLPEYFFQTVYKYKLCTRRLDFNNFQVLFFVLLATCLLVADAKGKKHKKNEEAKKAKARSGAGRMNGRDSKVTFIFYIFNI